MTGVQGGDGPTGLNAAILAGLDQVSDWGILTTDTVLNVTSWNRWLERHAGLTAEAVTGRSLMELFPDLVERRMDRYYRQALEGQVIVLAQRFHKYLLPMQPAAVGLGGFPQMQQSVRIAPFVDRGQITGTITLIEDVTERVAYESELRMRARQQQSLAALGQHALASTGLSALMQEAVKVAAETLGIELAEVLELTAGGQATQTLASVGWGGSPASKGSGELGPPTRVTYALAGRQPIVIDGLGGASGFPRDQLLASHGVTSGVVVPIAGHDRAFGILGLYSRDRRIFDAEDVQFLQAVANILAQATERTRLEDELRRRADALADADRRKDEFLAMLGHELRNPLAPIRNAVQVLRLQGTHGDEGAWARDVIDRQVKTMSRLVDDLLDVSRITRGKIQLQMEPCELTPIVMSAVETSRPLIESRGQNLTVLLPPSPPRLRADPARLSQVLVNLLNNAAKYSPEGARIWLTAETEGGQLTLRVRDTGAGIAAEMLPRIFDLFTQVERTLDRAQGGLGIGLTLVRSLVEMHGGTVEASSAGTGLGSEFVVHLPLPPNSPMPGTDTQTQANEPARARRILVVDDNRDAADSLSLLLRVLGHQVSTAYDGPSALERSREAGPEVVLLDIGLPGMDGYEVARRLRSDFDSNALLIVAMTGYGQEADRHRAIGAGFDVHLVKPVELEVLCELLGIESVRHG